MSSRFERARRRVDTVARRDLVTFTVHATRARTIIQRVGLRCIVINAERHGQAEMLLL